MQIHKIYHTDIDKEIFFEAWISPKMIIEPISKMECDPVVGGLLRLSSGPDSNSGTMEGTFQEVIWNERLSYSWHWLGSEETTTIIVTFKQDADKTTIEIQHIGFLTQESKDIHESGWDHYVTSLEKKIKTTLHI